MADIRDQLNGIRGAGCNGRTGIDVPLRANRELNAVAREWSRGGRLTDAFARVDYRALRSASMRISGSGGEKARTDLIKQRYCNHIVDESFKEIGVYERGNSIWVVVAAPFVTPEARDIGRVREDVLALVNEARGQPRKCGRTMFPAAPPLKSSSTLDRAALIHSQDMARKNFFEHQGSDRSVVGDRVARLGYEWSHVGENIAAGAENAAVVVRGWLDSPGHCANIMNAHYTQMGVAYVANKKSSAGIYWTQVLAAPAAITRQK